MTKMNRFRKTMPTPWGAIQWHHQISPGVVMVGTASHGGIWLSDERITELPDHYESYTGTPIWNEEDEDGGLVLQYLGLLSLIKEELTLNITEIDIFLGRESRKEYCGSPYFGGPIVEAYKRETGNKYDEMICHSGRISPRPGGFRLAKIDREGQAMMDLLDDGEEIRPTFVTLYPYIILEPKKFTHFLDNGTTYTEKVTGTQAKRVLDEEEGALEDYISYRKFFPNFEKTLKITYEGKTIYEKE